MSKHTNSGWNVFPQIYLPTPPPPTTVPHHHHLLLPSFTTTLQHQPYHYLLFKIQVMRSSLPAYYEPSALYEQLKIKLEKVKRNCQPLRVAVLLYPQKGWMMMNPMNLSYSRVVMVSTTDSLLRLQSELWRRRYFWYYQLLTVHTAALLLYLQKNLSGWSLPHYDHLRVSTESLQLYGLTLLDCVCVFSCFSLLCYRHPPPLHNLLLCHLPSLYATTSHHSHLPSLPCSFHRTPSLSFTTQTFGNVSLDPVREARAQTIYE